MTGSELWAVEGWGGLNKHQLSDARYRQLYPQQAREYTTARYSETMSLPTNHSPGFGFSRLGCWFYCRFCLFVCFVLFLFFFARLLLVSCSSFFFPPIQAISILPDLEYPSTPSHSGAVVIVYGRIDARCAHWLSFAAQSNIGSLALPYIVSQSIGAQSLSTSGRRRRAQVPEDLREPTPWVGDACRRGTSGSTVHPRPRAPRACLGHRPVERVTGRLKWMRVNGWLAPARLAVGGPARRRSTPNGGQPCRAD